MHDNIALAHDLTYDLNEGQNVIMKIDMAKAYDRLSWSFLLRAMKAMGFSNAWCDLIYRNISSCHYSIKWDGEIFGFFGSTRGVRQGDPLSPSLFVIAMEWLSKAFRVAVRDRLIEPYYTRRRALEISHLFFADDILVFSNGSEESLKGIKEILNLFCSASGQELSTTKSSILFSDSMENEEREKALDITGFQQGTLPFTYLGAPIYKGRTLISYFSLLEDRVNNRIRGWSGKFLSLAGKVTLVNSVLNTMAIHNMMVLPVPVTVINRIIAAMSNFIWDVGDVKRRHWVSWSRLCKPRMAGGLGLRDPNNIMLSLHAKLAWNYILGKSLWARYAKSRFVEGSKGSPIWNSISHLIPTMKSQGIWRVGKGDTSVQEFCWKLGVEPPPEIKRDSVRHVLLNDGLKYMLLHVLPIYARPSFLDTVLNDSEDVFSWKESVDGSFSTKTFYRSFQTRFSELTWTSCVWSKGVPPRISLFSWKIFLKVIPTEDTFQQMNINLASKCVCCHLSNVCESTNHLFFKSEWALALWQRMSQLFDRPMTHGLVGMERIWMKSRSPWDEFAFAMAVCGLWEIWKSRNAIKHDGTNRDWEFAWRKWVPRIITSIKKFQVCSRQQAHVLECLGVRYHQPMRPRTSWNVWQPSDSGYTVNVALLEQPDSIRGSFIIRNQRGKLIRAIISNIGRRNRSHAIFSFLLTCRPHALHPITCIQGSHYTFGILSNGDRCAPIDMLAGLRRCLHAYPTARFTRVCPGRNIAASAVVCTCNLGVWNDLSNLHIAAARALRADTAQLPHICGHRCTFSASSTIQDDVVTSLQPLYVYSPFYDDSNI